MHVVKPSEIAARKRAIKNKKVKRFVSTSVVLFIFAGVITGGYWFASNNTAVLGPDLAFTEPAKVEITEVLSANKNTGIEFNEFTGVDFRELYRSIYYSNTVTFTNYPEITGNKRADQIIRSAAEKRGFMPTSIPVSPIDKIQNEIYLFGADDDLLQPPALVAWAQLKQAAAKDGLEIYILSAYRSPKWQREVFVERLLAEGVTIQDIASGEGTAALDTTLSLTAVPGYSRHHTGYTIDLYCGDDLLFEDSICNEWITKNNYLNAKKFGWIPSYPIGGGLQGPEPEAWEYVWVGTELLYK